jgi:hypothetical protein
VAGVPWRAKEFAPDFRRINVERVRGRGRRAEEGFEVPNQKRRIGSESESNQDNVYADASSPVLFIMLLDAAGAEARSTKHEFMAVMGAKMVGRPTPRRSSCVRRNRFCVKHLTSSRLPRRWLTNE